MKVPGEGKVAPARIEARVLRDLSEKVPPAEARRILRRGMRIAAVLNDGNPDEAVIKFVCDALAQEGGLVQELVEELLLSTTARSASLQGAREKGPARSTAAAARGRAGSRYSPRTP